MISSPTVEVIEIVWSSAIGLAGIPTSRATAFIVIGRYTNNPKRGAHKCAYPKMWAALSAQRK